MTRPIYAIGDIHGHIDKLDRALDLIAADGGPDARIVFLGDYVDRGPDSRGVLDRLAQGLAAGADWHILLGNHDHLFRRFLHNGSLHDDRIKSGVSWLHPRLGGVETLASYGIDDAGQRPVEDLLQAARAAVPPEHADLLESALTHLEQDDLLFAHAGIRPGVPLAQQTEDDLIWIRDPFLEYRAPHPWLVVHGHTALDHPAHHGNRVNLDGGAGYGRPLHPAVFEGRDCWLLTESGRLPLTP